jgi:uncharacterized membrane protein (DUF2068 family)
MNRYATSRRRPGGITASSLAFGWLALAGFGNALFLPQSFALMPQMLRAPPQTAAWILSTVAGVYGLVALLVAVGLWRMRSWALRAYLVWVAAACIFMVIFGAVIRIPGDTPPILWLTFAVFAALVFFGWWRYIRSAYASASAL